MQGGNIGPKEFGMPGDIGENVDDVYVVDNSGGYATIAMRINVPTGGTCCFEASFDGINWEGITLRDVANDVYSQTTDNGNPFIGSIVGTRLFRVRTCVAGSAPGTVRGALHRQVSTLEGIEFGWPPHRFGFVPVHKDVSFSSAQTDAAIWTPDTGAKFVLTDLTVICGGTTDSVVTIFDGSNVTDNRLFKGTIDVSNNKQYSFSHAYTTPMVSSAVDNVLKLTTTGAITIDIVAHGYEI